MSGSRGFIPMLTQDKPVRFAPEDVVPGLGCLFQATLLKGVIFLLIFVSVWSGQLRSGWRKSNQMLNVKF